MATLSLHHYLPPKRLQEQLLAVAPLLPAGMVLAVRSPERYLGGWGEGADVLRSGQTDTLERPLLFQGQPMGHLLWRVAPERRDESVHWAHHLVTLCQGLMELEGTRRAVVSDSLGSLREIALLERASRVLNGSLRPREVAAALLGELTNRADNIVWGAVFLYDFDLKNYSVLNTCGPDSESLFQQFMKTRCFVALETGDITGIINDLREQLCCEQEPSLFQAILSLPLEAHNERVGLLVLAASRTEAFSSVDLKRTQALASMAATALRNAQLFAAETNMFRAFISMVASAIDAKSPYTAGHCRRVPEIARMLTLAACEDKTPPFRDFTFTEDDWETLEIATYLHDCGKVVTPEWVVDKPTKLSANMDRIELIEVRLLLTTLQEMQQYWRRHADPGSELMQIQRQQHARMMDDLHFLRSCNVGDESISPENETRLRALATRTWRDAGGQEQPLLNEDELANLLIRRGTLNVQERTIVEDHVVHTINMLKGIPFPPRLRNVVEYAGGHHECLNGRGYPNHLTDQSLSIPARIVAIADIFEALTAPDRPYRLPYTLAKTLDIMYRMSREHHIDPDLFQLFLRSGVYHRYAEQYLAPSQSGLVDIAAYLTGEA
jgi:HD-GYP domain-containing protein (c-di-GMP phosphodiesterase class II)